MTHETLRYVPAGDVAKIISAARLTAFRDALERWSKSDGAQGHCCESDERYRMDSLRRYADWLKEQAEPTP